MKEKRDLFEAAPMILKGLTRGVLLTTKAGEQVNTMTIGWGHLGREWNKLTFVVYVRESRYTKALLEESGEFTVNIPVDDSAKQILGFCGTKSGRDVDKIAALGLHLEEGETVNVPGIRELPLTLECKVIYKLKQEPETLPKEILDRFYSEENPQDFRDYHTAYYGEILNVYQIV